LWITAHYNGTPKHDSKFMLKYCFVFCSVVGAAANLSLHDDPRCKGIVRLSRSPSQECDYVFGSALNTGNVLIGLDEALVLYCQYGGSVTTGSGLRSQVPTMPALIAGNRTSAATGNSRRTCKVTNMFLRRDAPAMLNREEPSYIYFAIVAHAFLTPHFEDTHGDAACTVENQRLLVMFMRSGDIFAGKGAHSGYVQPPLVFYEHVMLTAAPHVDRMIVVTDEHNHELINVVLKPLLAAHPHVHVHSDGLATMLSDYRLIMCASDVAISFSSFIERAVLLSRRIERMYIFSSMAPRWRDFACNLQPSSPLYIDVYEYSSKDYFSAWHNAPAERKQMLSLRADQLSTIRVSDTCEKI